MKLKNLDLELMLEVMRPLLPHRDIVGYAAARNTRIISGVLTEYFAFKQELLEKYGEREVIDGKETGKLFLTPESPNFETFAKEFSTIKDIEQEVNIMSLDYDQVIGILNGQEILALEFMLKDKE